MTRESGRARVRNRLQPNWAIPGMWRSRFFRRSGKPLLRAQPPVKAASGTALPGVRKRWQTAPISLPRKPMPLPGARWRSMNSARPAVRRNGPAGLSGRTAAAIPGAPAVWEHCSSWQPPVIAAPFALAFLICCLVGVILGVAGIRCSHLRICGTGHGASADSVHSHCLRRGRTHLCDLLRITR